MGYTVKSIFPVPEIPVLVSKHHGIGYTTWSQSTPTQVEKLVSRRKIQTMASLLENARLFQENIKSLKESYKPNLIINTDQVGFFDEMTENRTLSYKGQKTTVAAAKSPRNLATHSYTIQYTVSMDGDVIRDVFLCLQ